VQPTPSPDRPDEPLYEAFYRLREQPFSLTTDPRFLYLSTAHRHAFDELLTGLRRHEGMLLLTGDTGTGKTTLCRAVIDALGQRAFSALILNPYMTDAEVLRTILRDFGLVTRDDIRNGAFARADQPQLLDTLEEFLRSLVPLNSYAVVIIDEAQSLSAKVLDQIRVLGSMEMDGRRLLQIVLVGQPSLVETLQSDAMRALADRISRRMSLPPLPDRDIDAYVRHRLAIAGGKSTVTFGDDAIARVADLSDGLPRRINLLCDRALELGRTAGVTTITAGMISHAAKAIAGAAVAAPEPVAPPRAASRASLLVPALANDFLPEPPALDDPASMARPPISDEVFRELDFTLSAEPAAFDRNLELIMDTPPPKSWGAFWIGLGVAAALVAVGTYVAVRLGWIRL